MILSIESSCDDSSIAITRISDKKVIFHKKISQEIEHSKYGGVVPELAARLHATALPAILELTKEYHKELKAIAVTTEPGLSVTLVEGLVMAKALCVCLNLPLIAVNHLLGHIYSLFIEKSDTFPIGVLLVSGGHTQLLCVEPKVELIAQTLDDSFGESFDKVSKMLGLGYPGGVEIEKRAKIGDENRFNFTIPLQNSPQIAFSYSGLKNQVRVTIESLELNEKNINDICASFQRVAVMHIIKKLEKVLKTRKFETFAVVGGASANLYLREKLEALLKKYSINNFLTAPLEYCSDNAVMIGRCAIAQYNKDDFVSLEDVRVNPRVSF